MCARHGERAGYLQSLDLEMVLGERGHVWHRSRKSSKWSIGGWMCWIFTLFGHWPLRSTVAVRNVPKYALFPAK